MKKWLALILSLLLLVSVCACSKDTGNDGDDKKGGETSTGVVEGSIPKGFENAFVYSTADGTYLYKPVSGETIKISDVKKTDGAVILSNAKNLVLSSEGKFINYELGSEIKEKLVLEDLSRTMFTIDGKRIIYIDNENNLYSMVLATGEKTLIADSVYNFTCSKDGKKIIYSTQDGKLCRYDGNEMIISDCAYYLTQYISDDLNVVVFIEDQDHLKICVGNTVNSIGRQVVEAYVVSESSIYFLTENQESERDIWYYNGTASSIIGTSVSEVLFNNDKLYFAEVRDSEEENKLYSVLCVADKESVTRKEFSHINNFVVTKSGKNLFYISGSMLFKVGMESGIGDAQLLMDGVNSYDLIPYKENVVYENYSSLYDDVDVYIDNMLIVSEGQIENAYSLSDYMFYTDKNGSLHRFSSGGSQLVYENIDNRDAGVFAFADGTAVYYVVADDEGEEAQLYYWNGSQSKEIVANALSFGNLYTTASFYDKELFGDRNVYVPDQPETNYPDGDGYGDDYNDDSYSEKVDMQNVYRAQYNVSTGDYDIYTIEGEYVRSFTPAEGVRESWGDNLWVQMTSPDSNVITPLFNINNNLTPN